MQPSTLRPDFALCASPIVGPDACDLERFALAILYARGGWLPVPCAWNNARSVGLLIASAAQTWEDASEVLRRQGLFHEAAILSDPAAWSFVERQFHRAELLSWLCPDYPLRWRAVLGSGAPPVVWRRDGVGSATGGTRGDEFLVEGPEKALQGNQGRPMLGWVGSRRPSRRVAWAAEHLGRLALELGYVLVSGGAPGIDSIPRRLVNELASGQSAGAGRALPRLTSILPMGLRLATPVVGERLLSVNAPAASFTSRQAMERNALIYAAAEATLVFQPRFGEGGTWHGAVAALRRRLGRVIVWCGSPTSLPGETKAIAALVALGAEPLSKVDELGFILEAGVKRLGLPSLFDGVSGVGSQAPKEGPPNDQPER